ncbi:MAG: hypothetical protein H8D22_00555 [Candidatus Cloacimonetes bacterium]|nr:hypothetical protein [Candidatus Cloacimonadota bacterium]
MTKMREKMFILASVAVFMLSVSNSVLLSDTLVNEKKGFNIVQDNQLSITNYIFDDFMDHYKDGAIFVCIYPGNNFNAEYFSQYMITELKSELGKSCKLEKYLGVNEMLEYVIDHTQSIDLTEDNFDEFKKVFITGYCLEFESSFPVKFLKVKTAYKAREIDFYFAPGDEESIEDAQVNNVIYYAYKSTFVGKKKYVFLGTKKYFNTNVKSDIEETLVGWTLYEDDGKRQNVVLWNTDIGLRPRNMGDVDLDRKPFVFLNDKAFEAQKYYNQGTEPNSDDLLVNTKGLNNFEQKFEDRKERLFRWLPLYDKEIGNLQTINIGVIDSLSVFPDAIPIPRMKKLHIAFLIDASKSMEQVWNNLDKVLINILGEVLNQNFTNIAGERITLKIKVYYFTNDLLTLNKEEFISSSDDVNRYKKKIEEISNDLEYTKYLLPSIYKFYNQIFADIGNEPFVTIVIGDAGDLQYSNRFESIQALIDKSRKVLTPIFGIAFNSEFYNNSPYWKNNTEIEINENITSQVFEKSYNRFFNNFNIIAQIDKPEIDENEIIDIAQKVSTTIVNEIDYAIDKIAEMLGATQTKKKTFISKDPSVFTQNYLDNLIDKLRKYPGTYFEEGIILDKDKTGHSILHKDVLIEEKKIKDLERTIGDFLNTTDDSNFKRLLRRMLAIFFEIDYSEVDQQLLRQTTLADFWEAVVGDRNIAEKIIPSLFANDNITFEQIEKNWNQFKPDIIHNASSIKKQINYQILNGIGHYQTLETYQDKGISRYIDYYWFEVDKLRLFKTIDFNGIQ